MKYYYLENSSNDGEIGIYPQCQDEHYIEKIDWNKIIIEGVEGKINWNLSNIVPICHSKAILTDFLSINFGSGLFLLITERFLSMISEFKINEFQSWKLRLEYRGEMVDNYYLFHSVKPVNDGIIVYESSSFEIGRIGDWKNLHGRRKIVVKNSEEFKEVNQDLRNRDTKELIILNKLLLDLRNSNLDLILLYPPAYGGFIISEVLKKEIEAKGYTGVSFKPLEYDTKIEVIYE